MLLNSCTKVPWCPGLGRGSMSAASELTIPQPSQPLGFQVQRNYRGLRECWPVYSLGTGCRISDDFRLHESKSLTALGAVLPGHLGLALSKTLPEASG